MMSRDSATLLFRKENAMEHDCKIDHLLHEDDFSNGFDQWHHEGIGHIASGPEGGMRLHCHGSRQGAEGCMAFFRPTLPDGIRVSYKLNVRSQGGLVINYVAIRGLNGEDLIDVPTHRRILRGLAYIPQHPGIFRDMSVEDNLLLGAWTFRRDTARIRERLEANYARFPILRDKRRQNTGELSGGQQRMVEIGRTLMGDPKVLLVDEPTAGLSKILAEEVYQMLRDLRDRDNLGILLVDQEIRHALRIADYVYVLELGRNKFEGPPSEFGDLQKAFWVA
jgi:branched-chain amino acid transport system ATP-binding protein